MPPRPPPLPPRIRNVRRRKFDDDGGDADDAVAVDDAVDDDDDDGNGDEIPGRASQSPSGIGDYDDRRNRDEAGFEAGEQWDGKGWTRW